MKKTLTVLGLVTALLLTSLPGGLLAAAETGEAARANAAVTESTKGEETVRVIIQTETAEQADALKHEIGLKPGAKICREFGLSFNGFSADIKESEYLRLQFDKRVKRISKSRLFYPTMHTAKAIGQIDAAISKYKNKGEGMVISIIDSGLDVTHKDFQKLDNPAAAKIKDVLPLGGENKDTKFNLKVPYGYNFADHSYRVKGFASNHGIHVSGIASANASDEDVQAHRGIDGVASQAQILAMTVFSNNSEFKGAQEDDIIAAIERSIEKKADVINMSLGSPGGFMDDADPTAKAIKKATEHGIVVVVAAGNETAAFADKFGKEIRNVGGRQDIGIVGSPSTARAAFSVASMENTHEYISKFSFAAADGQEVTYPYSLDNGVNPDRELPIVLAGLGKTEDYNNVDCHGKLALVKRGQITFTDKAKNAKAAGAAGIIIYNSDNNKIGYAIDGMGDFPVFNILNDAGEKLREALAKNPALKIHFKKELVQSPNENSGCMSSFSSFGTTNDLSFKPEITGIGGKVYSTDNNGKYVMMNGTSMASPYVAGATALVMSQAKKENLPVKDYVAWTKTTLMNTAKTVMNKSLPTPLPYSVRRQGAGLIQVQNAMDNRVALTYETADGSAAATLRSFNGSKTFKAVLRNLGKESLTFTVEPGKVYTTETVNDNLLEKEAAAQITADRSSVTVPAGGTAEVKLTINATKLNNSFVEGFVRFVSQKNGQPDLHLPYLGFAGDFNKESIFDNLDTADNRNGTFYGETRLMTLNRNKLNPFSLGKIVPLGLKPGADARKAKPLSEHWAISPNNDGLADAVIPEIAVLRNAARIEFNILNSKHEPLRRLGISNDVRRQSLKSYIDRKTKNELFPAFPYVEGIWDGRLYNPKNGKMEIAPDGQYYLAAKAYLTSASEPQELVFPLKVDTKTPQVTLLKTADQKEYELTPKGRLLKFKVEDAGGVAAVKAEAGKKELEVKRNGDHYEALLPYGIELSEDVMITADDYAYNKAIKMVEKIKGNQLSFINWQPLVTKKINPIMGNSYSGQTKNKDTKKIALKFVGETNGKQIISKDCPVDNGKFPFASYVLKPDEQGKYQAYALEKDANGLTIKETSLGKFVYDYTKPTVTFNYVRKNEVSCPDNAQKNKKCIGYVMRKNKDGTATYTGQVHDNVFSPKELTLSIGMRDNVVKIKDDGSFTYVLKTPSKLFDFINVSQPGDLNGNGSGGSSSISWLNLILPKKAKGLENTYLVSAYLDADQPDPATPSAPTGGSSVAPQPLPAAPTTVTNLPPFKMQVDSRVVINRKDLTSKVRKDGQDYFYTIECTTSRGDYKVFFDGQETKPVFSNSSQSRFRREVKLKSGNNEFNIRCENSAGEVMKDLKVRIIFDSDLPNLVLRSPLTAASKSGDNSNAAPSTTPNPGNPGGTSGSTTPAPAHGTHGNGAQAAGPKFEIIETWQDQVTFAGTVSDNGKGYRLYINGDSVASHESNGYLGDNAQEFKKVIPVKDNDIITLELNDIAENSMVVKYKIKKVAPPDIIKVEETAQATPAGFARITLKTTPEVSFDVKLGTVKLADLPLPKAPENTEFVGWYLDSRYTKPAGKEISAAMVLYPKFKSTVPPEQENESDEDDNYDNGDSDTSDDNVIDSVSRLLPRRDENPTLPEPQPVVEKQTVKRVSDAPAATKAKTSKAMSNGKKADATNATSPTKPEATTTAEPSKSTEAATSSSKQASEAKDERTLAKMSTEIDSDANEKRLTGSSSRTGYVIAGAVGAAVALGLIAGAVIHLLNGKRRRSKRY